VCFAVSPFQAIRMIELFLIDLVVLGTEQLVALTRAARKTGAELRSLRTIVVGGGVPTRALLEATAIHLCRDIRCRYGTSEFGVLAEARPSDVMQNPGLVGHVVPGLEIAAFDAAGDRRAAGEAGVLKGRLVHDKEGAGAGWVEFGDVGWITAAGELYVTARTADAVIEGRAPHATPGISPAHEVEHLLRLEWDMTDAAAVAVSDGGMAPQIWIATVDGKDVSLDRLAALLRLRGIDLPLRWFQLPAIPRGASGKVNRAELKAAMLAAPNIT
jgi:acyl-coenzyme A synthetase/AMP-(fatty) acid ligase